MKKVYVVLVNWNGWADTLECLESLCRSDYPDFCVIVSDNGSTDGSLVRIKDWAEGRLDILCQSKDLHLFPFPRVKKPVLYTEYAGSDVCSEGKGMDAKLVLISNSVNLGFAGGNNVGLRYALQSDDFSYVWLLNNDTVVEPDALTRLVERMEQQPSAGMCGSTIRLYQRPGKIQALGGGHYCRWIGLPWHYGRFRSWGNNINERRAEMWMNYVEGASMLVTREFLKMIGLMCEDYFLYFEEVDWAMRANGRFKIGYAPQSIVYHKVGSSIGTSSNPARKSFTCDYFNIRNRLMFTRRFHPAALPTIYLILFGAFLLRLFLGKWDRAVMILRLLIQPANRPIL